METQENKLHKMERETVRRTFETVAIETLPTFFQCVRHRQSCFGDNYLCILVAVSETLINNVALQYPQLVSFSYDFKSEELTVQMLGGCGGNRIFIIPQKNKYLAMESVKIPFRKAKGLSSAVKTFRKFLINYREALRDNSSILMYQNLVNYSEVLK